MSTLSPLWVPRPRANPYPSRTTSPAVTEKVRTERNVGLMEPAIPVPAPSVPVERQRQVAIENLTADDVAGLSISTINSLIPHNPKLVARLIVDSGRRRRAELPTPMSTLKPMAHAVLLCGMRRRSEKLSDVDEAFLAAYLEEIDAA
jgi:hypothetical protein